MLDQRLADALHNPAMDLPFEQQRVDGAAEIIDHSVTLNADRAGIGIDFQLDDVASVGKGLRGRNALMRGIEPGLHAGRQLGGIARFLRHLEKVEVQVGAGDPEYAVRKAHVRRRDFQKLRGELRALLDDRAPRLVERRSADGQGASLR